MAMRDVSVRLTVRDEASPAFAKAGASAAKMAADIDRSGSSLDSASKKVASASRTEADALGKVQVAQARLDDVRAKGNSTASQRIAAEENLAKAVRDADAAQESAAEAATQLAAAQNKAAAAAADSATGLGRMADGARKAAEAAEEARAKYEALGQMGQKLLLAGTAMAAGLGAAAKAAMDWESAFAGVQKTVDGVDFGALEGDLRELAKTMPVAHKEIAATAQAAGALGVAGPKIASFTKTALQLGEAVDDLSAEEAATAIAQISNVMGTFNKPMRDGVENVDRFASALVHLGNNGASTEGQILRMATRMAGAAATVGMSEQGVLALSNTFASMGVRAELGGGVATRALLKINTAVMDSGAELDGFADLAGVSAREFAAAWGSDPAKAMLLLADGMAATKEEGGNLAAVLEDVGFKGTEDLQVMLSLANGNDVLRQSIIDSAEAWGTGTAHSAEAAKRYETDAAKIQTAWNKVYDAAINVGGAIAPILSGAASAIGALADAFSSLPEGMQQAIGIIGGIATAATLLGGAALTMVPKIAAANAALVAMGVSATVASAAFTALGIATGVALVAGLALVAEASSRLGGAMQTGTAGTDELALALTAVSSGSQDAVAFMDLMGEGMGIFHRQAESTSDAFYKFGESARLAMSPSVWEQTDFIGQGQRIGKFEEQVKKLDASLAAMVAAGNAEGAAAFFDELMRNAEEADVNVDELRQRFETYIPAAEAAAVATTQLTPQAAAMAESFGLTAEEILTVEDALESLDAMMQAIMGRFNLDIATDNWNRSLRELPATIKAANGSLTAYTEAGENVRRSMEGMVSGAGDIVRALVESGASTDVVSAKKKQLNGQLEEEAKRLGVSTSEVQKYTGAIDDIPETASTDVSAPGATTATGQIKDTTKAANNLPESEQTKVSAPGATNATGDIKDTKRAADDLPSEKRITVSAIISGAMSALSRVGNKIADISSRVGVAIGGGYAYADGGIHERHVAQIAPAGAWRVWAEPETGGESYIPLAASKRARSLEIWRETGRRLGVEGPVQLASGGILTGTIVPTRLGGPGRSSNVSIALGPQASKVWVDAEVSALTINDKARTVKMGIEWDESTLDKLNNDLSSLLTGIDKPAIPASVEKIRSGWDQIREIIKGTTRDQEELNKAFADAGTKVATAQSGLATKAAATKAAATGGSRVAAVSYAGALGSAAAKPYRAQIIAMAAKYGVPAELIASVIKAESNFKANAGSSAGARGLMQLMPGTFKSLGVGSSITNPNQNIEAGTKYLSEQLKKFGGSVERALRAYNAGPAAVQKSYGYKETNAYVAKVTADAGVKASTSAKGTVILGPTAAKASSAKAAQTAAASGSSDIALAMVEEAKKALGTAYKWGGGHGGDNTKKTLGKTLVDCSGLINVALASITKKNVSKTAKQWLTDSGSQKMSVKDALNTPGALLGNAGHVVISMGDGKNVMEAPSTGKKVKISNATNRKFAYAAWRDEFGTRGTATRAAASTSTAGSTASTAGSTAQQQAAAASAAQALSDAIKERDAAKLAVEANKLRAEQRDKLLILLEKNQPYAERLARSREETVEKLTEATEALAELEREAEALAANTLNAAISSSSLSQTWQVGADGGMTPLEEIVRHREEMTKRAVEFGQTISRLRSMGLNETDLADLVSMGSSMGNQLGTEIAESGLSAIAALNNSRAGLETAATALGDTAAEALYGAGHKAGQALIDGLEATQASLEKKLTTLADKISEWVYGAYGLTPATGTSAVKAAAPVISVSQAAPVVTTTVNVQMPKEMQIVDSDNYVAKVATAVVDAVNAKVTREARWTS